MTDNSNLRSDPAEVDNQPISASTERTKDGRDTAAGCRERATADLAHATGMPTLNGRQVFEKSAASWTKRADMLQRIETGIETRQNTPDPQAPELTAAEIAEDEAHRHSEL